MKNPIHINEGEYVVPRHMTDLYDDVVRLRKESANNLDHIARTQDDLYYMKNRVLKLEYRVTIIIVFIVICILSMALSS